MRGTRTIRELLRYGIISPVLLGLVIAASGCTALHSVKGTPGRLAGKVKAPPELQVELAGSVEPAAGKAGVQPVVPDAVRLSELLERAAQEPRRAEWQAELADYWLRAGQPREAESYAVRAIGLNQHCTEAWRVRAEVAAARSEWNTALGCYQQVVNSSGEESATLSRIATCHEHLGEPRRALSACERAVELSAGEKTPHDLLVQQGRLLAGLGQFRRANAILQAAVNQPVATASSWLALMEAQVLAGETALARGTLARARELFPGDGSLDRWQQAQVALDDPLASWK